MLKSDVPVEEYILMSGPAYERCESALLERVVQINQEIEGVGMMTSHFVDLDAIAHEPATLQGPSFPARLRETAGVVIRCFPRVVGIVKFRAPDKADTAT